MPTLITKVTLTIKLPRKEKSDFKDNVCLLYCIIHNEASDPGSVKKAVRNFERQKNHHLKIQIKYHAAHVLKDLYTKDRKKANLTSVKCHGLSENNWPVECDENGLFVSGSTDFLLQSVPQTNPSLEVCHLVEI